MKLSSTVIAYGCRHWVSVPSSKRFVSISHALTLSRRLPLRCRSFHFLSTFRNLNFLKISLPLKGNSLSFRMEKFWGFQEVNNNKALVKKLKDNGVISSEKVAAVMEHMDRALFVPAETQAYDDSPMPIGYNATISAPHMHATCLQLLKNYLQPGMHALDVGSGTGYLTACFAVMVGDCGCAVGVEHIPELFNMSVENIKRSQAADFMKNGSLSVHVGDGRKGWPDKAPYDAIHVGAATPEIPKALIEQLKPGGRMVIPVGNMFQQLQVVDKNVGGSISVHNETSVRYVPLTSKDKQLRS